LYSNGSEPFETQGPLC